MMKIKRLFAWAVLAGVLGWGMLAASAGLTLAATGPEIRANSEQTLTELYNTTPAARELGRRAKGILVFPEITKGGIGIGGAYGEGSLWRGGQLIGYYSVGAGSVGLTLGAQKFSQVVMFMTQEALDKFVASKGWEAGVDGSVVAIDEGTAGSADTASIVAKGEQNPIVGFIFGQQGLMFDASFKGMKYSRIER